MRRLIILLLCAITWAASAQAQVSQRSSWHYLKADANDTCRFVTNDKGDTLPVYFDGSNWVMGKGDSTHILNDVLVIGDSDTDCVYIRLFNGVDSTYFRLDSANGNLQYSNDYSSWNDIGGTDSTGIDADGDGVFESYLSPAYIKKGAGMQLTVSGDTVEIASTVTGTTNADSLRGLLVQTKAGNVQDNYILKVTLGISDTTLNWEADQTGAGSGSEDTLKIVVGATDYSIINNFIKLGFRLGLEVVRGDSAGVDTIYLSVDPGYVMEVVEDSLAADTALWHEAYDTLAQWTDAITAFRSMLGDTAKVYCIALDGSNVMSGKLTAQHGILTDSLHTVKLYISSDIITDFSGAASGLKVNGGLLVIDSVGTGMIANQAVTKEKIDTTDYFRVGGLAIRLENEDSWALGVLSKGGLISAYNGIALMDTIADTALQIYFYVDNSAGAQRTASFGLFPSGTNEFFNFQIPYSYDSGTYVRFRIYGDSIISFEPFYVKDRFYAPWIGPDTIYLDDDVITKLHSSLSGIAVTDGVAAVLCGSVNIVNGEIKEEDLKVVNTPNDEELFTYEATGGDFEWHTWGEMGLLNQSDNNVDTAKWREAYDSSQNLTANYPTITDFGKVTDDTTKWNTTSTAFDTNYQQLTVNSLPLHEDSSICTEGEVSDSMAGFTITDNPHIVGDMRIDGQILQSGVHATFDLDYIHAELPDTVLYTIPIYANTVDSTVVCTLQQGDNKYFRYFNDSANIAHFSAWFIPAEGWPSDDPTLHGDDSCIWIKKNWWEVNTPYGAVHWRVVDDKCENPHIGWSADGEHYYRPYKIDTSGGGWDTIWAAMPICPLSEAQSEISANVGYQSDPNMFFYSDGKMYIYWRYKIDNGGDQNDSFGVVVKSSANGIDWPTADLHIISQVAWSTISSGNLLLSPSATMGPQDSVYLYALNGNLAGSDSNSIDMWIYVQEHPESTLVDSQKLHWIDTTYGGNTRWAKAVVEPWTTYPEWSDTIIDTCGFISSQGYCDDSCADFGFPWHFEVRRFFGEYHCFANEKNYYNGGITKTSLVFLKSNDGRDWTTSKQILRPYKEEDVTDSNHFAYSEIYKPGPVLTYNQTHGWYYQVYLNGISYQIIDTATTPPPAINVQLSNRHHISIVNVYFDANSYDNINFNAIAPDGIADTFNVMYVDPEKYPDGIRITKLWGQMDDISHAATYNFTFEEWTGKLNPALSNMIDTISMTSDSSYSSSETFNHSYIEAGNYIRIGVPSTDVAFVSGGITFYRRDLY